MARVLKSVTLLVAVAGLIGCGDTHKDEAPKTDTKLPTTAPVGGGAKQKSSTGVPVTKTD